MPQRPRLARCEPGAKEPRTSSKQILRISWRLGAIAEAEMALEGGMRRPKWLGECERDPNCSPRRYAFDADEVEMFG
jgi:hypothetical protein